jgi:hypothetical protein
MSPVCVIEEAFKFEIAFRVKPSEHGFLPLKTNEFIDKWPHNSKDIAFELFVVEESIHRDFAVGRVVHGRARRIDLGEEICQSEEGGDVWTLCPVEKRRDQSVVTTECPPLICVQLRGVRAAKPAGLA